MKHGTIKIDGINYEVNTDLTEVFFCGGITIDGVPVNCTQKKVSRSVKNAAAARKNPESLIEIKPGYYML